MKKTMAMVLVLMMALSMAACGGSAKQEAPATEAPATEAATEAAAEADAEESEGAEENIAIEEEDGEVAAIQNKGTLVIGITDFEPMDYRNADGEWIGFDADMAKCFAESLGVEPEFVEINWDNKIMELNAGTIDCVWNGMTLTDEVMSSMECSAAYCNNAQVVVVKKELADSVTDTASLTDLSFAAEAGSAGEACLNDLSLNVTPVTAQSDAVMEVASGTVDACVIDALMAAAMVGEGTGYEDLVYTISLNSEEYGVGFRQGSDLAQALNDFFKAAYADGTMNTVAETYGVQAAVIAQ